MEDKYQILQPTCMLRWVIKEIHLTDTIGTREKVLQQKWISDTGEEIWKDIELHS